MKNITLSFLLSCILCMCVSRNIDIDDIGAEGRLDICQVRNSQSKETGWYYDWWAILFSVFHMGIWLVYCYSVHFIYIWEGISIYFLREYGEKICEVRSLKKTHWKCTILKRPIIEKKYIKSWSNLYSCALLTNSLGNWVPGKSWVGLI